LSEKKNDGHQLNGEKKIEIETIKNRKKVVSGLRLFFLIIFLQDRCYPDVEFYGEKKSGKSFI